MTNTDALTAYIEFDPDTGQLLASVHSIDDLEAMDSTRYTTEWPPPDSYMDVQTKTYIPRPENTATIDKLAASVGECITVSDIPNPSTVVCAGFGEYTVEDGVFEVTYDLPGVYKITIDSFPPRAKTFEVEIT